MYFSINNFLLIFSGKIDDETSSIKLNSTPSLLLTGPILSNQLLTTNDSSQSSSEGVKELERKPLFSVQNSSAMAKITEVNIKQSFNFFNKFLTCFILFIGDIVSDLN